MNIVHEIVTPEGVVVQFAAGEWAKVKHFFEGTSTDATVQQAFPEGAAVQVTVSADELAAAKQAHAEAVTAAPAEPEAIDEQDLA